MLVAAIGLLGFIGCAEPRLRVSPETLTAAEARAGATLTVTGFDGSQHLVRRDGRVRPHPGLRAFAGATELGIDTVTLTRIVLSLPSTLAPGAYEVRFEHPTRGTWRASPSLSVTEGADGGISDGSAPPIDGGMGGVDAAVDQALSDAGAEMGVVDAGVVTGITTIHETSILGPASVATRGQKVYLGVTSDGAGLVEMGLRGESPSVASLAFFRDDIDLGHRNNSRPTPYPSIGIEGCAVNTRACGPDNEQGRGYFGGLRFGGRDWLVLSGARNGGRYVYFADDEGPEIAFRYVDFPNLGGRVLSAASADVVGGALYVGFLDSGGGRPLLMRLAAPPLADPGSNPVEGVDTFVLPANNIPGMGVADPAKIDAVMEHNGFLHFGSQESWVRAVVAEPTGIASDWVEITPSAAAYGAHVSVSPGVVSSLTPQDFALPGLVDFRGVLYAARNTLDGPQIFACDEARAGLATECDAGDWVLVAANTSGETTLSQFNNPANTVISLFTATDNFLYVGFDNAVDGVTLFRAAAAPMTTGDFEGDAGCDASAYPSGCSAIGEGGFGAPPATRIYCSTALPGSVYFTVGDGTTTTRLMLAGP